MDKINNAKLKKLFDTFKLVKDAVKNKGCLGAGLMIGLQELDV